MRFWEIGRDQTAEHGFQAEAKGFHGPVPIAIP